MGSGESSEATSPRFPYGGPMAQEEEDGSFGSSDSDSMDSSLSSFPSDLARIEQCGMGPTVSRLVSTFGLQPQTQQEADELVHLAGDVYRNNPGQCTACANVTLSPEQKKAERDELHQILEKAQAQGVDGGFTMHCYEADSSGFSWKSMSAGPSGSGATCTNALDFSVTRGDHGTPIIHLTRRGMGGAAFMGDDPGHHLLARMIREMPDYNQRLQATQSLLQPTTCQTWNDREFLALFEDLLGQGYVINSSW